MCGAQRPGFSFSMRMLRHSQHKFSTPNDRDAVSVFAILIVLSLAKDWASCSERPRAFPAWSDAGDRRRIARLHACPPRLVQRQIISHTLMTRGVSARVCRSMGPGGVWGIQRDAEKSSSLSPGRVRSQTKTCRNHVSRQCPCAAPRGSRGFRTVSPWGLILSIGVRVVKQKNAEFMSLSVPFVDLFRTPPFPKIRGNRDKRIHFSGI